MGPDVLVLGWGKAGKTLARVLGAAGQEVVLVEQSREMYGGTCINVACVPTKALVVSAERRREGDDVQQYFEAAVERRDNLTAKMRTRNEQLLAEVPSVTVVNGRARFTGPRQVEVTAGHDRLLIAADTVVINTGTEPARPAIAGVDGPRVYDSTTIQHVRPLPEDLVIVGGGFVGLEFAGMFARFGSRVVLLHRGERLLAHEDDDVAAAVLDSLVGVDVRTGVQVTGIVDDGGRVVVTWDGGSLEGDAVLLATGRSPVTADLALEAAGVEVDERGYVVVDETLRTSAPGVFAVGDVNGGPQFTYISYDDHRIVLDQLQGSGTRRTTDRIAVPVTTFLTPPLARVGLSEREARAEGMSVKVAAKRVADIAAMPRPKILGETHGLIKVVVDATTDQVLGATWFGVDGQEVINLIALAMRSGVTATELRDGIYTHPSSTEALNEVLTGL
jgi:pyruvate/2-oxoglutarate dehydrogenase complex dihydrolipoamide dehydrogenase (E3) component